MHSYLGDSSSSVPLLSPFCLSVYCMFRCELSQAPLTGCRYTETACLGLAGRELTDCTAGKTWCGFLSLRRKPAAATAAQHVWKQNSELSPVTVTQVGLIDQAPRSGLCKQGLHWAADTLHCWLPGSQLSYKTVLHLHWSLRKHELLDQVSIHI